MGRCAATDILRGWKAGGGILNGRGPQPGREMERTCAAPAAAAAIKPMKSMKSSAFVENLRGWERDEMDCREGEWRRGGRTHLKRAAMPTGVICFAGVVPAPSMTASLGFSSSTGGDFFACLREKKPFFSG